MVWCRVVLMLKIKDLYYEEKWFVIDQVLVQEQIVYFVFYQDEVDIDLNLKIGVDWMFKG